MGQRSLAQETWRRFKRNRLAIAGMVFIGVLLAISVITVILDLVNPELYNNLVVKNDLLNKLAKPSPEHTEGEGVEDSVSPNFLRQRESIRF